MDGPGKHGEIANRWTALANAAGSHRVTEEDARRLVEQGGARLIIGTGQYGVLKLSPEAAAYLEAQNCIVELAPTSEAIGLYNAATEPTAALFHLTC